MAYYGFKPAEQAIQIGDNTIVSADIADGSIVNADLNASAAIALSKTQLVAGTGITLATNTLNVDAAQTQITSVGTLTSLTTSGVFLNANGSASAPSFSFSSDTNTGIYRGAENVLRISTDGTERFEIGNTQAKITGNFITTGTLEVRGTGSSSFAGDLLVSSSDPTITIKRSNSSSYAGHLDFTNNADALGWQVGTNQVAGDGFEVNYGASNKFYVTTGGNFGIGTGGSVDRLLHVQGGANSNTGVIKIEGGQPWLEMQSAANTWSMYVGDAGGGDFYLRDGDPTGGTDYLTLNAGDGNASFAGKIDAPGHWVLIAVHKLSSDADHITDETCFTSDSYVAFKIICPWIGMTSSSHLIFRFMNNSTQVDSAAYSGGITHTTHSSATYVRRALAGQAEAEMFEDVWDDADEGGVHGEINIWNVTAPTVDGLDTDRGSGYRPYMTSNFVGYDASGGDGGTGYGKQDADFRYNTSNTESYYTGFTIRTSDPSNSDMRAKSHVFVYGLRTA